MRAVTWRGVNEIGVEDVAEPTILNDHDIILEVGLSATCGSDLHLVGGYIPAMRAGDVLGHEFMGTVAEVGRGVTKHQVGDRVVVVSFTSCGQCWYCRQGLFSLCDNGNPNPGITEALWGQAIGGCYGYSHAMGGYAGSHARYVRVPYADQGAFPTLTASRTSARSSPPTRLRPGGPVRTRPVSRPATWSPCGEPGESVRWRPARPC
jgi:threonine dehydrogenase-like Zn-dependent dehydrogenase